MPKLKVLGKFILAKPIEISKKEVTGGFILTTNTDKVKKNYGVVEYIGQEVTSVKIGDTIIFETKEINQLEIGDDRYFLIIESEVIAIDE